METPLLAGLPSHSEAIVHWHYTPEEWRRFGTYEGRYFHKVLRDTKIYFFVFSALTVLAMAIVPLFGLLKIVSWDLDMLTAVFVIMATGGFLLGISAVVWLMQKSKLSTLTASTGDVVITLTGISTSGLWHHWNYDDRLGRRFHDARTMTINEGKPDQFDLLEVRTIANTLSGKVARDVISSCRVPIPAGKRPEAEMIVGRFGAEKARPESR